MFGFCCRRFQSLVPTISVDSSLTHFQKTSPFTTSLLASEIHDHNPEEDPKHQSFTVSYLINSCGFSPQVAHSLSKKRGVCFNSPERADSVIKLLKHYGFSDAHVFDIVKKRPDLLVYNAQTLMPKLEFFNSVGISGTALAHMISGNPKFLTFSLEGNLKPCFDIIKSLPVPDKMVGLVLSRLYQGFTVTVPLLRNIAPNFAFLKEVGVPVSAVHLCRSMTLFIVSREPHRFKENLERLISMGITSSSSNFMNALYVISAVDEVKWEQRMELFKATFGWTDDDFFLAFKRAPMIMGISEKLVLSKVDFLVKRMGWEPALVAASISVLTYSLENWIMPRCSVIRVLLSKGLIMKREFSLGCIGTTSKNYFLDRFVIRYQEQVPELLDIFQGKMSLADVGLRFEETGGATIN